MTIGRIDTIQTEYITVAWGNGLMKASTTRNKHGEFIDHSDYCGFYVEQGRDSALDDAMAAANIPVIETEHPNEGGVPPTYKRHWDLGREVAFYPLTQGAPAATSRLCLHARNRTKLAQSGIGLAWVTRNGRNSDARPQTVCGVICYLAPLVAVGYTEPLKLVTRGMMTEYLIQALVDHARAAKYADHIVDRTKHPDPVGLWELQWRLGRSEKKVGFTGRNGASSLVYPIVSLHPRDLTPEYIRAIYLHGDARTVIADRLASDWEIVQDWAAQFNTTDDPASSPTPSPSAPTSYEGIVMDLVISDNGRPSQWALGVGDDQQPIPCVCWHQNTVAELAEGDVVTVTGTMQSHQRWGDQFVVETIEKMF